MDKNLLTCGDNLSALDDLVKKGGAMKSADIKAPVISLIDQMLAATSEFIDTAYKMVDSCRRKDKGRNSYSRLVIAFYMRRAIELTESFIILLRHNRLADSALLLRSFWEMGINTGYIFRSGKEKEINAIRSLLDEDRRRIELLERNSGEFEASGLDIKSKKAEIERHLEEAKASFTKEYKTDDWKWKRIRSRAEASEDPVLKQVYYLVYPHLCSIEHHDASFGKNYVEEEGCKPLKEIRKDFTLRPDVNLIMCRSILLVIMKTFNEEFCLRWGERLKLLEAKQGQEYAEMKKRDHK